MHIAIASDKPNCFEVSKPEPIAKPSGILWSAIPSVIIIPVFNKLLYAL